MLGDLPPLAPPGPEPPCPQRIVAILLERPLSSLAEIGAALWPGLTEAERRARRQVGARPAPSLEQQLATQLLRLVIYAKLRYGGHRGESQGPAGLTFYVEPQPGGGCRAAEAPCLRLTDLPWGCLL